VRPPLTFGLGLGLRSPFGSLRRAAMALFNNAPFVWSGSRIWRNENIWRD